MSQRVLIVVLILFILIGLEGWGEVLQPSQSETSISALSAADHSFYWD